MILALATALLLSGPVQKPAKCIYACERSSEFEHVVECFFDELPACGRKVACVESEVRICTPRAKLLWIENYISGG